MRRMGVAVGAVCVTPGPQRDPDGPPPLEFSYRPTETAQLTGGDDHPTLFDALREKLGLKLTPARAPVSVLVIDSASLPTPD